MRKPLDKENVEVVDVINPMVREFLEAEFLQDRYPTPAIERKTEKQADEVGELFKAQDLTDQGIEEAIKVWYHASKTEGLEEGSELPNPPNWSSYVGLPKLKEEDKLLSSHVKAPVLELKTLPTNLKYVYLGDEETLPVIISSELSKEQEDKLVDILKRHKKAIGWTLADIAGISPDVCMHNIHLEEGAKPHRDAQRKLNPNMRDVVPKEILKLLAIGVIYPISDSN